MVLFQRKALLILCAKSIYHGIQRYQDVRQEPILHTIFTGVLILTSLPHPTIELLHVLQELLILIQM